MAVNWLMCTVVHYVAIHWQH